MPAPYIASKQSFTGARQSVDRTRICTGERTHALAAGTLRRTTVSVILLMALGFGGGCHHRKSISLPNTADYADNIRAVVVTPQLSILRWPNYSDYQAAVKTFYDDRDYELAWLRDLKPTVTTNQFIAAFENADQKGLNPQDYDAGRWASRLTQIARIAQARDDSTAAEDTIAQFDAAMTICVMRYISDLRIGRVNPQHFNFDIDVKSKKYDLAEFVSDNVVDTTDLAGLMREVEPDSTQYRATEAALQRYLAMAKLQKAANAPALPDVPKDGVGVGGSYATAGDLMARLQLEGDAPGPYPYHPPQPPAASDSRDAASHTPKPKFGAKTLARAKHLLQRRGQKGKKDADNNRPAVDVTQAFAPPHLPPVYTAELADAVRHYQARHALEGDGRLTQATIASLNVPLTQRVMQLDDSLERWRWLPDQYLNAPLMVNLPEFVLRGYNPQHQLDFTMRVVVGKVMGDHDTPVFTHMMRYLIFRPYWNVPRSIITKELMPKIQASGTKYLAQKNFEVTDAKGNVVTDFTAKQIEHGGLLIREKPGPTNSLGLVKFMFPNQYDIYLHSTPQPELFSRSRRDFSHGCIRVQKPEDLAVWVLSTSDTPGDWNAQKVHDAMQNGPNNHQVNLKNPIPVVIFYLTALAEEDGQVHFFDDLYGYDQKLQEVLSKGPPYPVQPDPTMPIAKPGDTAALEPSPISRGV